MTTRRWARLRRVLRSVAIALAVACLVAVGLWFWLDRKWGRELDAEVAAMKRDGLLLPLEALFPDPGDSADNAAPLCEKAVAAYVRLSQKLSSDQHKCLDDYAAGEPPDPGGARRTRASREAVRDMLADPDAREALDLFERGAARPRCAFAPEWDEWGLPPLGPRYASRYAGAVSLAFANARLQAEEGRSDAALHWCKVGLAVWVHVAPAIAPLRRSFTTSLSGNLAVIAEAIAQGQLAGAQVARLDGLLASFARAHESAISSRPLFDLAVWDRFYGLLQREPARAYEAIGRLWDGSSLRVAAHLYYSRGGRPVQKLDHLLYLRAMRTVAALAPLAYRDAKGAYDTVSERNRRSPTWYAFADALLGGGNNGAVALLNCWRWPLQWAVLSSGRERQSVQRDAGVARVGLTRVLLAAQAYYARHGCYPTGLTSLEHATGRRLPRDPFSGRPFGYLLREEGFRLYSTGPNLVDDGGKAQVLTDWPDEKSDIVVTWPDDWRRPQDLRPGVRLRGWPAGGMGGGPGMGGSPGMGAPPGAGGPPGMGAPPGIGGPPATGPMGGPPMAAPDNRSGEQ